MGLSETAGQAVVTREGAPGGYSTVPKAKRASWARVWLGRESIVPLTGMNVPEMGR